MGFAVAFDRRPCELILREEFVEKTPAQRKLFHAVCADIAPHWGLTPDQVKAKAKEGFYGIEMHIEGGRLDVSEVEEFQRLLRKVGPYTLTVQSSEDSDREEYSRLTDYLYQMAAESGVHIADRRTR